MRFNLEDAHINIKDVSDGDSGGMMKLMLAIEQQFMNDPKY